MRADEALRGRTPYTCDDGRVKRSRISPESAKHRAKRTLYLKLRERILARDAYRCAICGKPASQTHHILYRSQGGPDEGWNLISLDLECHELVHREGPRAWRETLHFIAARREAGPTPLPGFDPL